MKALAALRVVGMSDRRTLPACARACCVVRVGFLVSAHGAGGRPGQYRKVIEGPATGQAGREKCGRFSHAVGDAPQGASAPDVPVSPILKQPFDLAENTGTVGIEDRWYMRRTPPPSRPPGRPSRQPLPRRTGAGIRLLIIALVGIILILATLLTAVEAQRCREGFQAPVCRI